MAIEEADPDAGNVIDVLDGIPGAYERAHLGIERARAGESIPLEDIQQVAEPRRAEALGR